MARQQITVITDDLGDGAKAHGVSFTHDGLHYEIDLSEANDARLQQIQSEYLEAMQPFLTKARQVVRPRSVDVTAARIWARGAGLKVPSRGPLPAGTLQAYEDYLAEGGQAPHVHRPPKHPSGVDAKAVRAWAAEHGIEASARGPLPAWLVHQYEDAQIGMNVDDQTVSKVKSWAKRHGLPVTKEISESVLAQYLADEAQRQLDEPRRIRSWASERGIQVAPRGPISESIVALYRAEVDS